MPASLLNRIKNSDVQAFDIVFKEYYNRLCAFAVEHGVDGDVAGDIVQDVMVSFWDRRSQWSLYSEGALKGYLFQSVRNLIMRHYRDSIQHKHATEREIIDNVPPAMGIQQSNAQAQIELDNLQDDLRAVIDAMPPDRRVAVSLRLYDDLPYEEIAEIMGIGAPAVRMHLSRAREALAAVFRRHKEG